MPKIYINNNNNEKNILLKQTHFNIVKKLFKYLMLIFLIEKNLENL